jgi:hypothetical protein
VLLIDGQLHARGTHEELARGSLEFRRLAHRVGQETA